MKGTRIRRWLAAAGVLLAGLHLCAAQDADGQIRAFQQEAGDNAVLYRGLQAPRYDFSANGHPYAGSPEFVVADIVSEGRLYRDIPLNIDAVAQCVVVRVPSGQASVALQPAQVDEIRTGGHLFTGVGADDGSGLPAGIYEVIGADRPECVYKLVRKQLRETTTPVNGDRIGYYDPYYNPALVHYFAISKSYYFRDAAGQFSRIRGRGALLRRLGARKAAVRRAWREAGLNGPDADFDHCCLLALSVAAR